MILLPREAQLGSGSSVATRLSCAQLRPVAGAAGFLPTAPQQDSPVSYGAAAAPEEGKARSAGTRRPSAASLTKQGTWPSPGSRWAGTHKGK